MTAYNEELFYSLVNPKSERKKRKCLKCRKTFTSMSTSNRLCGHCKELNTRQSIHHGDINNP